MSLPAKVKAKTTKLKAAPKRPVFKAEPDPDTLPSETEPQILEPVYTKPKERPPMPERFVNGGGTAEERQAWIKENWG